MTQPEGQSEAPATETADSNPADAFEAIAADMLGDTEDEPEEADEGDEPEASEGAEDDTELEAEDDDLPPIDAPVSWDAEAKELFKSLPREAQEVVQKREAERERFVQSKAQEAARARQEVEQAALSQLADIERQYAQHYQAVAQQFDMPEPDPALLASDPHRYAMEAAEYRKAQAQRQQAQQTAQQYAQQAQQREQLAEQAFHAEQVKIIEQHIPEYLDPTTGPKLQQELSAVARELGYPAELIAEARATDIIAMKKVADLKAKADKYDALQAKKMEKVRAAKGLPKVATPGVAQGAEQTRKTRSKDAWERVKTSSGAARDDAMADYLKSQGIL